MKICSACLKRKNLSEFGFLKKNRDGRQGRCKPCFKDYYAEYNNKNRDSIKRSKAKWASNNPEYNKKYRDTNKEELAAKSKLWRSKNPDKCLKSSRLWKHKNKALHANKNLIYNGLRHGYTSKAEKTIRLLGADYKTVWSHLKQTWKDRYKKDLTVDDFYEVDHVIPCWIQENHHYTNLQLLTPMDNKIKSSRFDPLDLI